MRYYINVTDGYIDTISTLNLDGSGTATEEQYEKVKALIEEQPTAPEGFDYRLQADTLEWELVELPPMPHDDELTAEEALNIITGGAE